MLKYADWFIFHRISFRHYQPVCVCLGIGESIRREVARAATTGRRIIWPRWAIYLFSVHHSPCTAALNLRKILSFAFFVAPQEGRTHASVGIVWLFLPPNSIIAANCRMCTLDWCMALPNLVLALLLKFLDHLNENTYHTPLKGFMGIAIVKTNSWLDFIK